MQVKAPSTVLARPAPALGTSGSRTIGTRHKIHMQVAAHCYRSPASLPQVRRA